MRDSTCERGDLSQVPQGLQHRLAWGPGEVSEEVVSELGLEGRHSKDNQSSKG